MDLIVDTIQGFLPQVSDTMILDVVTTIILLLGVIFFKVILVRLFTAQDRIPFEIRKRRTIHIRNNITFIFIIGVVLIWSKELLALALPSLRWDLPLYFHSRKSYQAPTGQYSEQRLTLIQLEII